MIRTACQVIFPLITFPYVSRVLHVENIGIYNFCQSVISYFSLLAALGISTYAIREGARYRDNEEKMSLFASEVFSINFISTVFSYLILGVCILLVPRFNQYSSIMVALSISIMFTLIGSGQHQINLFSQFFRLQDAFFRLLFEDFPFEASHAGVDRRDLRNLEQCIPLGSRLGRCSQLHFLFCPALLVRFSRCFCFLFRLEQTDSVIREAFLCLKDADSEEEMVQKIHAEKFIIAPDCATCLNPCGNTSDYDMAQFYAADVKVISAKRDLIETVCKKLGSSENVPEDVYQGIAYLGYDLEPEAYTQIQQKIMC